MDPLRQCFLCTALSVALVTITGCTTTKTPPQAKTTAATAQSTGGTASPEADAKPGVETLFDGKTLKGWKATDFAGKGEVKVANGEIELGNGYMTGVTYTGDVPRMNYEVSLDAKRVEGSDFFCGLTFPVDTNYVSFIVGGWGGGVVGLSSIDSEDASQNETTKFMNFTSGRWYHVRVRVTPNKIQTWIDDEQMADLDTTDKRLSIRLEVEASTPLGIATWNTASALKNITLKKL